MLRTTIAQQEAENEKLRVELRHTQTTVAELRQQSDEFTKQLDETLRNVAVKNAAVQAEADALKVRDAALTAQFDLLQQQLQQATAQLATRTQEVASLQTQVANASERLNASQRENATAKADLERRVAEHTVALQRNQDEMGRLKKACEDEKAASAAQTATSASSVEGLNKEIQRLQSQLRAAQSQAQEASRAKAAAEAQQRQAAATVQTLTAQLANVQKAAAEQEEQLRTQLAEQQKIVEESKEYLETATADIAELEDKLTKAAEVGKTLLKKCTAAEAEAKGAWQRVNAFRRDNQQLTRELTNAKEEKTNLQAELQKNQDAVAALEKKLAQADAEVRKSISLAESRMQDVAFEQRYRDAARKENTALVRQVAQLEDTIKDLRLQLLEQSNDDQVAHAQAYEKVVADIGQQALAMKRLRDDLETVQDERNRAATAARKLTEEVAALKQRLTASRQAHEEQQRTAQDEYNRANIASQNCIAELQQAVTDLQRRAGDAEDLEKTSRQEAEKTEAKYHKAVAALNGKTDAYEQLEQTQAQLVNELSDLREQHAALQRAETAIRAQYEELQGQAGRTSEERQALQNKLDLLGQQFAATDTALKDSELRLLAALRDKDALQTKLSDLYSAHQQALDAVHARIGVLEGAAAQHEQHRTALLDTVQKSQDDYAALNAQHATVQQELEGRRKEAQHLQESLTAAQQQSHRCASELAAAQSQLQAQAAAMEALQREKSELTTAHAAELATLQQASAELHVRIGGLEADARNAQADVDRLQTNLATSVTERAELQRRMNELQQQHDRAVEEHSRNTSALNAQVESLSVDNRAHTAEIASLTLALEKQRSSFENLTQAHNELHLTAEQHQRSATSAASEKKAAETRAQQLEGRVALLEAEKATQTAAMDQLNKLHQSEKAQTQQLREALALQTTQHASTMAAMEAERDATQQQLRDAHSRIAMLEAAEYERGATERQLQSQVAALTAEVALLRQQLTENPAEEEAALTRTNTRSQQAAPAAGAASPPAATAPAATAAGAASPPAATASAATAATVASAVADVAYADHEAAVQQLHAEIVRLRTTLQNSATSQSSMEAQLKQAQNASKNAQQKLAAAEAASKAAQEKLVVETKKVVAEQKAHKVTRTSLLERLHAAEAEKQKADNARAALQSQVSAQTALLAEYQDNALRYASAEAAMRKQTDVVRDLQAQLSLSEQRCMVSRREKDTVVTSITSLQTELTEKTRQISALDTKHRAAQVTLAETTSKMQELTAALSEEKDNRESAEARAQAMETTANQLKAQVTALTAAHETLQETLHGVRKAHAELQTSAQRDRQLAEQQLERANMQVQSLRAAQEAAKAALQKFQTSQIPCPRCAEVLQQCQKQLEEAQSQLRAAEARVQSLESGNRGLRAPNSQLGNVNQGAPRAQLTAHAQSRTAPATQQRAGFANNHVRHTSSLQGLLRAAQLSGPLL